MLKNIFKIVLVFITGMGGGIFTNRILWPYKNPAEPGPVYLTEKNEITIEENIALQNAVEKVEKAIVGVKTRLRQGYGGQAKTEEVLEGSGIIITSDGLMVTLAELLPQGESSAFFIDGKMPKYQVLKRDLKANLALVKIEEINLSTIGFADFGKLRLGERVFLVGIIFEKTNNFKIVNEGIVKFFTSDYIRTNIFEKNTLAGSPLFNIQGELLGLNTIDSEGKITAIPVTKIRAFIGF